MAVLQSALLIFYAIVGRLQGIIASDLQAVPIIASDLQAVPIIASDLFIFQRTTISC